MEINDTALDFCQNLLSYTYNAYFREKKGLPIRQYRNPIGEVVLHISNVHIATFKRILQQNLRHPCCKDRVEFLRCTVSHSIHKILNAPKSFLTSAALLVAHMNVCFDRECYRFLQTSPLCLYVVLDRLIASHKYRGFDHFYRDLVEYGRMVHVSMRRSRSLAESAVEEGVPECVRMMQRMLVNRMTLRELRVDMDHLLYENVPSIVYLQNTEIETVVSGDFSFDENGDAEGICEVCETKCSLNYEMYLLEHRREDLL